MGIRCWLSLLLVLSLGSTAFGEESAADRLQALIDEHWEFRLDEDPLFSTRVGDHRANDRLTAVGLADQRRRHEHDVALLDRLIVLDRSELSAEQRVNLDVLARLTSDRIHDYRHGAHLMPITNRSGFHVDFPQLPGIVPLRSEQDYDDYISRLEGFDGFVEQHVELMRAGIERGYVLPGVTLVGYELSIDSHVVDRAEDSLLFNPFRDRKFPESFAREVRARLAERGRRAIASSVLPGFRRFKAFMEQEYVPAARSSIGASELPDGRAFYEHRVRRFTTLDLTPQQVHETGLAEVARIRAEMQQVIESTGFEGTFPQFLEFLRTDPRFYVDTPEALMREVGFVLKKMDGELPRLFRRLPRMPYGIRRVPGFIAPRTTTAYYERPAGDGTKAGFYFVNTHDLPSRPLYEIEALSLHEAVPGHHLQIALQQELEELPPFRRYTGFTAFVEGWALYAERLGLEVGFYADPYSDFGRLTYEMWRACRLVVDTGMHYFGWSRQRAIDFMAANSALTLHNIQNEVDRYISWPGQALGYKIGELKIRELRALAQKRLGARFDLREFHDVVLSSGSVPLSVLQDNVERYIAATSAR